MDREIILAVGDWIQAAGIIPSLVLLVDYGIFAPRRRNFEPTGIRYMILGLALGFLVTHLVVFFSLLLGPDYWGREWFRLAGYLIGSSSVWFMLYVYALESRADRLAIRGRVRRAKLPDETTNP